GDSPPAELPTPPPPPPPPPPAQVTGERRLPSVTWRSVGIGLLLIPVNAYWLVQMEQIRYSAHPTTVSLFFNAVFILLVVTLANALVGRLLPRIALRRGELLAIYAMIAVASALPAHDLQQILVPMLVWPYRFLEQN